MNVAPDKIRAVIVSLDEGTQLGLSLSVLLNQVLPAVAACIPDVQYVRIYRFIGQIGKLEATTDTESPTEKQLSDIEREAMQAGVPMHDRLRWIAPLLRDAWVFGWLEVETQTEQEDMLHLLNLLTYALARSIEQVESSNFTADNLVLSSRLITTADNYSDMAQAAVYTIARSMAGVAITLFDQPLEAVAQPSSRSVVALGAVEGPIELSDFSYTEDLPDEEQFKNLWRGLPVIEQNFSKSGFALTVSRFTQAPIKWLAAFGLRAGDRVLGTLEILNTELYQLLPEEIDAYTTLADQIGVAVRNRQLLHQTSDALDEVRTLYEMNRAMIGAQDRLDVLRALHSLSPDALNIMHLTVGYDENDEINDLVVNHRLTTNSEQVVYESLRDVGGDHMLQFVRNYGHDKGQAVVFIEDVNALNVSAPPELLSMAKREGIESAIILYIYERERLRDIIRVGFNEARTFDAGSRRLYEALADQIVVVFQNQRLLQETQISTVELSGQVRVLQTLNTLAATIATTRDESKLLEETARALALALNVDGAHIMLLTPGRQSLVVAGEYPPNSVLGREFDVSSSPTFQAGSAPIEPIIMTDIEADERLDEGRRETFRAFGIHSVANIFMYVQNELIGVIGLELRQEGRQFAPQAIEIGRAITGQVAIALQNIRLLNSSQRQAEQLQRASSFSQQLQATLDLRTTLEMALTQGRQIVSSDYMAIALALTEDAILRTAAVYFNGESAITAQAGSPVTLENTIIGSVWQAQEFIQIPDIQLDTQRYSRASLPSDLRSLLVTPIFSRGNCLGVMLVGNLRPYAYSDVDEVVFGHMASQVAVAVDNSTMYDRSQRMAASESLVNDITARLQQQVDIPSLMSVTATELGRALGARRARVRLGTLPAGEEKAE